MSATWFLFALLSVFALAGAELSQKISLIHKANIGAITNNFFVWVMQGLGAIVIALIFHQFRVNAHEIPWVRLLLIGIVYFAGGTFYYTSYKANSPSISIILGSISIVISTSLGILFFHESTVWLKFLGIALILSSIVFVNSKKKFSLDKYNIYALMGGVCFGVAYTIDKSFVLQIPASIYLFLMCFSVAAVSFVAKFRLIIKEAKGMNHENYLRMFFWLSNMNPLSVVFPITAYSLITTFSVYYVFKSLYSEKAGLIGSFLYSIGMGFVWIDRWAVPTVLTFLWVIWFYYSLIRLLRKKIDSIYIFIILAAFIWYVHIAFLPLFILVPIAFIFSGNSVKSLFKQIDKKILKRNVLIAVVLLTPFFLFELRHGFQQIKGVYVSTYSGGINGGEVRTGKYKMQIILEYTDKVFHETIAYVKGFQSPRLDIYPYTVIGFFLLLYFLVRKRYFKKEESVLISIWFLSTFLIHFFSKRTLTEYYFNNLMIPTLAVITLFFVYVGKKFGKYFLMLILLYLLYFNGDQLVHASVSGEYQDRIGAVNFIASDVKKNNYPCAGINFIGDYSTHFGYRYLFWYRQVREISPGNDVPVYSIVRPAKISGSEVDAKFGDIGIILPVKEKIVNGNICKDDSRQLLPLNGFTN